MENLKIFKKNKVHQKHNVLRERTSRMKAKPLYQTVCPVRRGKFVQLLQLLMIARQDTFALASGLMEISCIYI